MAQIEKTAKLIRLSDTELTIANPAEDIRDRAVVDRNGEDIGEVEDLLIDAHEKRVRLLEVASGGFLGLGKTKFLLPVEAITRISDNTVYVNQTRQYIASAVPDELIEAAYMDGAGPLRVLWSVVVPAARPAMAVLGMLTFLMAWNDFFWPIIVLSSQNPTVQVSFQSLATGYAPQQSIIMAGTLYGTVPVLVVFALLGRQIVGGIMQGAVKG